ncbi:MAG: hypothetical protein A4S09_06545 [Proteobacteria bacterium SG_bin7]|nr:MAG: hypothetical protein A4S09_06545 [Proteobacteria bacterium SG_bin7]
MKISNVALIAIIAFSILLVPVAGYCSVESTLGAIQSKLINTILPLCAVLGLVFSAFSFFTGNPSARSHLWLAIIGMIVGFGAPSIVTFLRGLVN